MKSKSLYLAIAFAVGGAMVVPSVLAKGKPTTEATNNLSVPTILVGGLGTLVCGDSGTPSPLMHPTGTPQTGYDVPGYYWVQKVHKWQAQCFNADSATVFGAWGDNLAGEAKLKVGTPIRVELALENRSWYSPETLQGYDVIKLQNTLDRLSAYGHQALEENGGWRDNAVDFASAKWLVHNQGITFSVLNNDTGVYAVPPGTSPTAEINATGKVVYGYNLRVSQAGNYRIEFTTTPAVKFMGVDAGALLDTDGDVANGYEAVYIDIVVIPGGGGKR